jgi:tetratricopeptide (TPR) repeat protein
MELTAFDDRTQRLLVHALAGFLDISPEAIKVCSVEEGSVKLVVELPTAAAELLLEAGKSGVISLEGYLDSLGEIRVSEVAEASEISIAIGASASKLTSPKLLKDSNRDPYLLLTAYHTLARAHLDLGQQEQALSVYRKARHLYKEVDNPLVALRLAWQEGQLLRDLGELRAAEAALLQARQGFIKSNLLYETAMVSLDLASVYLKLNMTQNLQEIVAEAVPIFRALNVDREAIAALLQLGQVNQSRQAFMLIHELTTHIEELKRSRSK